MDCPRILNLITDEWIGSYSDPQYVFQFTDFAVIISVCTVSVVMTAIMNNNFHLISSQLFILQTTNKTSKNRHIKEKVIKISSNKHKDNLK